jgi:hypothetical protein
LLETRFFEGVFVAGLAAVEKDGEWELATFSFLDLLALGAVPSVE